MATVSKDLAEQLITELQKQKRPRYYCVVRYWNAVFRKHGHALLADEREYRALLTSLGDDPATVLWASPKFKKTHGT